VSVSKRYYRFKYTNGAVAQTGFVLIQQVGGLGVDVVELNGSMLDLRGTAATKPLATAVTIGATYWSVDTDPNADAIEVSDGTNWVVL
jgi:hypothetical protein